MNPPPRDLLHRYLAHRRPIEVGFWVVVLLVQVAANTTIVAMDVRRSRLAVEVWEILTWEASSNLVWLALVPLVLAALRRWPLHWGLLRRHLPRHFAASVGVSVVHVLAMVALRHAVYAWQGVRYDFGHWPTELAYEAVKDVRSYAMIVAVAMAYRLLLWRWQGEASLLAPDDHEAPAPASPPGRSPAPAGDAAVADALPDRFLVRKLGKEFLLPVGDVEWVQACGNYVNLRREAHDYPLRSTLAAIEKRLDPARFVRVHRSYLVNLEKVAMIEPTEAGDARIAMRGGGSVPCSRSHLAALRQRLR